MKQIDKFLTTQYPSNANTRYEFKLRKPDQRLRLARCQKPLALGAVGPKSNAGAFTIRVRCPKPNWEIYVSGRRLIFHKVWITTQSLQRGERIAKASLKSDWRQYHHHMIEATVPADLLVGARTMRTLRAGDPLPRSVLCLVCKGDKVEIIARVGPLRVKAEGVAQQNGLRDDVISVYNSKTRRAITARVVKDGTLIVDLGS